MKPNAPNTPEGRLERLKRVTRMPIDAGGNGIPAICLSEDRAHHLTAGSSASKNTKAFDDYTSILSVFVEGSGEGIYLKFGDSTVVATTASHHFPAGVYYNFALKEGMTHMSVLRKGSSNQTVHISECY